MRLLRRQDTPLRLESCQQGRESCCPSTLGDKSSSFGFRPEGKPLSKIIGFFPLFLAGCGERQRGKKASVEK